MGGIGVTVEVGVYEGGMGVTVGASVCEVEMGVAAATSSLVPHATNNQANPNINHFFIILPLPDVPRCLKSSF